MARMGFHNPFLYWALAAVVVCYGGLTVHLLASRDRREYHRRCPRRHVMDLTVAVGGLVIFPGFLLAAAWDDTSARLGGFDPFYLVATLSVLWGVALLVELTLATRAKEPEYRAWKRTPARPETAT